MDIFGLIFYLIVLSKINILINEINEIVDIYLLLINAKKNNTSIARDIIANNMSIYGVSNIGKTSSR